MNKVLRKDKGYGFTDFVLNFPNIWNILTDNYSNVLCGLTIAYFICLKKTTYSYRCLCDPEDMLLICLGISITLPGGFFFVFKNLHSYKWELLSQVHVGLSAYLVHDECLS